MSVMSPAGGSVSKKRKHDASNSEPVRKTRKLSPESDSEVDSNPKEPPQPVKANKHTKRERKQNRSTRIHSIRKLLARDTLPSTIRQDKERELSSLLLEQEQGKTKKQSKKTLEKYHYVRFVERQKAEKKLKQLRKKQQQQPDDATIEMKIHEMEVSRNYAIYAPLSEKYVSIFASKQSADQRDEQGSKPPMWYTIEKAMKVGETALVAIREGKGSRKADVVHDTVKEKVSSKSKKEDRVQKPSKKALKESHSRVNDKGSKSMPVVESSNDVDDEDLSDGGFFER